MKQNLEWDEVTIEFALKDIYGVIGDPLHIIQTKHYFQLEARMNYYDQSFFSIEELNKKDDFEINITVEGIIIKSKKLNKNISLKEIMKLYMNLNKLRTEIDDLWSIRNNNISLNLSQNTLSQLNNLIRIKKKGGDKIIEEAINSDYEKGIKKRGDII